MDAAIQPTAIRRIASDRPWHWLALGWNDFTASLAVSLPYGAALTLAGWVMGLLMFEAEIAWAILPAGAGSSWSRRCSRLACMRRAAAGPWA